MEKTKRVFVREQWVREGKAADFCRVVEFENGDTLAVMRAKVSSALEVPASDIRRLVLSPSGADVTQGSLLRDDDILEVDIESNDTVMYSANNGMLRSDEEFAEARWNVWGTTALVHGLFLNILLPLALNTPDSVKACADDAFDALTMLDANIIVSEEAMRSPSSTEVSGTACSNGLRTAFVITVFGTTVFSLMGLGLSSVLLTHTSMFSRRYVKWVLLRWQYRMFAGFVTYSLPIVLAASVALMVMYTMAEAPALGYIFLAIGGGLIVLLMICSGVGMKGNWRRRRDDAALILACHERLFGKSKGDGFELNAVVGPNES